MLVDFGSGMMESCFLVKSIICWFDSVLPFCGRLRLWIRIVEATAVALLRGA
jgi:hypothetical protein